MMVGRFLSGLHGEGDVIAWLAASQAAFQALVAARLANHISQRLHVNPQKEAVNFSVSMEERSFW